MVDNFNQAVVSSIGYFIRVNPHYIHRESFQEEIFKVIEQHVNFQDPIFRAYTTTDEEDLDTEFDTLDIPAFELGLTPIKFGNGSFQSASEAVDIIGTKETAPFLKEIFCSIDFGKHHKGCMFLPRGMIQMTSVDTFKKYINLQNQYLNSVDCIPILGLSLTAARYPIVVQTENGDIKSTIIGALELFPVIQTVYQTNATPTVGKWLVIHLKSEEAQVKKFLDEDLERLFLCIPDNVPNKSIEDYEYPRRPGLQRRNGHTLTYATLLQQKIEENPPLNGPSFRVKRAPAAIIYHEPETSFPPLKKTNFGFPSNDRNSTMSTVTTESLKMNEITELIDTKINSKMNEVIQQTDVKIKAAVDPLNAKIDKFDSSMNANFKQLSEQMAALFGNMHTAPPPASTFVHLGTPQFFTHPSLAASPMTLPHAATNPPPHE
jgi:hypothetical protein